MLNMLLVKRLPTLSTCKINSKIRFELNIKNSQLTRCDSVFLKLCRSYSVLHNLSSRAINPKLKYNYNEYKAAIALLKRSNLPGLNISLNRDFVKKFHTSNKNFNEGKDKDKDKNKKDSEKYMYLIPILLKMMFWLAFLYVILAKVGPKIYGEPSNDVLPRYVSWGEFVHTMLSKGEVKELIIQPDIEIATIVLQEGAVIKGKRISRFQNRFYMNIGDVHRFEEKLREAEQSLGVKEGVPVTYTRDSTSLSKIIPLLLIALLFYKFSKSKIKFSIGNMSGLTRAKFTLVDSMSRRSKGVKFEDVAGLKEPKIEIMEFVDYLKRPEHYKSLGAKVPKGALLLGPPGCGKTMLAKAVATEANVPFLSMNGSEFIDVIGGLGAARVRDLFKQARSKAPSIIYIDEMDALGRARSSGSINAGPGGGEWEQTLNQLLVEMDGMKSREGVVVLASTNRAEVLDKALLRPGRFDRHILIDLPTLQEREEIFARHLKNIILEELPPNYVRRLAHLTPAFSGADIANVCNEAALHAARHKHNVVRVADLEYALERVVGGTEKRSHAMSPSEKKIIAYHESGHALVGWYLEHTDALLKISIVPRTNKTLGFAQYTTSDQKLYTKEQLFDRMCMALGGRAAEAITFNSITSGAENDLKKVTKIAYAQVRMFGMSNTVGLMSYSDFKEHGKKPFSNALKNLIDMESKKLVAQAYFKAEQEINSNKDKLKLLAEALMEKETLDFKDVLHILGPPPFPNKKFIEPAEFEASLRNMENIATNDSKGPQGSGDGAAMEAPMEAPVKTQNPDL